MGRRNLGIWNYIRFYRFNSILIKNFLLIISSTVLPLIIIIFSVYTYNTANIRDEIKTTNINALSNVRNMVDTTISRGDMISAQVAAEEDITSLISYREINPSRLYKSFYDLYRNMGYITSTNDIIDSVYVYFENSNFIFSADGNSMDLQHFSDKGWFSDYELYKSEKYHVGARKVSDIFGGNVKNFISIFRAINNNGNEGMAIVNIDIQKLKNIIDNADNYRNGRDLVILGKDGTIIYSTDLTLITKNIKNEKSLNEIFINKKDNYFTHKINDTGKIITMLDSQYNGWEYISITPLNQYSQRTYDFRCFLLIAILICIVIAIIISFFISIKIFQPVKEIVSLFKTSDDWSGIVQEKDERGFNEFKYITKNILNSLNKTTQMENELKERLKLLRKAQTISLQAQINPHFLFNTLETINWKAMMLTGGENEVSKMIGYLSQLLRLSLETENSIVTVETEIKHVKCYLDIQKICYKNKFDVIWKIDSRIYGYKMIKLTLQPLVENAISHGIKPKSGKGIISIEGKEMDDYIEISVTDDGIGMPPEAVAELNESMKDDYIKENSHIGIKNVNQRIKLIFGDEYGATVESRYNEYTRAILKMPKEK